MICAQCGISRNDDHPLCPNHHLQEYGWADNNRAMCEALHRGHWPPRVGEESIPELEIHEPVHG